MNINLEGLHMMKFFKAFLTDDSGASAAEYALILAIVGTSIAGAAVYLGNTITTAIANAANTIKNPPSNWTPG